MRGLQREQVARSRSGHRCFHSAVPLVLPGRRDLNTIRADPWVPASRSSRRSRSRTSSSPPCCWCRSRSPPPFRSWSNVIDRNPYAAMRRVVLHVLAGDVVVVGRVGVQLPERRRRRPDPLRGRAGGVEEVVLPGRPLQLRHGHHVVVELPAGRVTDRPLVDVVLRHLRPEPGLPAPEREHAVLAHPAVRDTGELGVDRIPDRVQRAACLARRLSGRPGRCR